MVQLTQEIVRELLDCDPETGTLTWKCRDRKWFKSEGAWKTWNKVYAGSPAFVSIKDKHGRTEGAIFRKKYVSYRMFWFWLYGEWPDQIDHINGDPTDNRISNLRNVNVSINQKNLKISKRNTSGFLGVSWDKRRNKWTAFLNIDKRTKYLGSFSDIEDAKEIVRKAREKNGYHENHGRI